jgi:phenylalanyl-tRNA synthetase beta chain
MKFSESWLRNLVDTSLDSDALAHLLTMAGLEVEASEAVAPSFSQVVIAQVLSKEKHPDADRLNLLTVDVGQAEPLVIVCGAQNVTVGMKAPCALVGAKLPGIEIKAAKVRGVASFGMMCSAKEIGMAEESAGLLELPADAPIGQDVREYFDLNDRSLTLKLTPNRCDCLSLFGIAREVAALTKGTLHTIPAASFSLASEKKLSVKITAEMACPRYIGRVISGVNAQAITPTWMVRRLERSGLHSISALVDVTNYVLLELGQPLHAFDLAKLTGGITVRFAREDEKITLLNEQTISLKSDMLVVADEAGPQALAGIMGGSASAVSDATTEIFLESAFFAPSAIVGKSRLLGFGSDSSFRFERGVDFANTQVALDRATQLILEICGGAAAPLTEVISELPLRSPVKLRLARIQRVLGISLAAAEIADILQSLNMSFVQTGEEFMVTPPSYRFDISIEEDLIEEVARVHGYEAIQPMPPMASMTLLPRSETQRSIAAVRQIMVQRDYQEVINYAFVTSESERDLCGNLSPIVLQNPIASQMSVMRSSLLGGLLTSLRTNLARKQPRVRVFEIGACFAGEDQNERLAGLCYGDALSEQWGLTSRAIDFYDIKADVEALFSPVELKFTATIHPASHPGRSAQIWLNGKAIGWVGELHPQWLQQYDIPQAVIWFEVSLDALLQSALVRMSEVSKFPPVRRDLAVLVDEAVTVETLLSAMRATSTQYVVDVALFDVYRGKGVEQGKKSLAFRALLQDTKKTLTDNEIEENLKCLVSALQDQGAVLRA